MKKGCEVFWSPESKNQIDRILDYLGNNFSEKEIRTFLNHLSKFEFLISIFPELFPASIQIPGIRKAVISKQVSIFYYKKGTRITIQTVWDNRQNPDSLKKK